MRYPIMIEPGNKKQAFGVIVPDLPGCFSAGDSLDEAMASAEEAIAAWIDAALDSGMDIPKPSALEALRNANSDKAWIWGLVNIESAALDDTSERINISLPRRVLRRLDALAKAAGDTRSGFIARMTLWEQTIPMAKAQSEKRLASLGKPKPN